MESAGPLPFILNTTPPQHVADMPVQQAPARALASRRTRCLVALTVAVIFLQACRRSTPQSPNGVEEVFAAAGRMPFRVIEARPSGSEIYRPLRLTRATRGNAEEAPIESLRNVARVQKLRGNDYAAGVAELLSGRIEDAISSLEPAVEKSPALNSRQRAAQLSDLSAAFTARAKSRSAGDEMRAADWIEQAWQLDHTPAIAWNRALAREALFLRKPALAAWIDYLKLDRDSAWSGEAMAHIRRLRTATDSTRWLNARARLEAMKEDNQAEAVGTIVRDFPQQSRELAEQTLLGGDDASLRLASLIGRELVRNSGDYLVMESALAAQRDPKRHLDALVAYNSGRSFLPHSPVEAVEPLSRAERGFGSIGSPFKYRAAVYSATAKYYEARLDDATTEAAQTIAAMGKASSRYPTVVAQLQWVISLAEGSRGHLNEAMAAAQTAATLFASAGERENEAAMEEQIAASYRLIGQSSQVDSHQQRALELLAEIGESRRTHAVLTEAAIGASKSGLPRTALLFQTEVIAAAQAAGDSVSVCDALIGNATYAAEAGDRSLAIRDLDGARRELAIVGDAAMHNRVRSNLLAAEAVVWRTFAPERAAQAARAAIDEMTQLGHRPRLVQIELEAGRALAKLNRDDEALGNWHEGIAECERERSALPSSDYRLSYFEQCRALFDESVTVLARRQRFADAYHLAERGRARGLLDAIAPASTLISAPERVPQGLTIVEYSVLPDAVVIWLIDANGITGQTREVRREELSGAIDRLVASRTQIEFNVESERLYQMLLQPIASHLAGRVVFIPDGELYRVPFAALRDRSGQFLVQSHVVSIAPSATLLMHSPSSPRPAPARALLIDAGSVENDNHLVSLQGASDEIAAIRPLYPGAAIVRGNSCTTINIKRALREADVVHFAGHALPGGDLIEPTLVLQPSAGNTGLLYARDIAALPLRSLRLVVLGACGTAGGKIGSEGPLSIARAFLAAGASRAVATLWPIDDTASVPLLVRFHRSLQGGSDAAPALQETQIQAIKSSIPAQNWAAFEVLETETVVRQKTASKRRRYR
jgi:CHAT domain-containing protein